MAATRIVEDLSQYDGDPAGWTDGRGITHYIVAFVEGLTGDDIEAAVAAEPGLPDTCTVTYLDATAELRITFQLDDTPGEGEGPLPGGSPLELIDVIYDDLVDGL